MIVGSEISELRSENARARETRSRKLRISSSRLSAVGVVERRRDEAAAAQEDRDPDVDALAPDDLLALPGRVQLRDLAQRERDRLDQEHAVEEPVLHRAPEVLVGEPARSRGSGRSSRSGRRAGSPASSGSSRRRSRAASPPAASSPPRPAPGAAPAAAARTGAARRRRAAACSTSWRWMRPPGPEPRTVARSTPSSAASVFAEGETQAAARRRRGRGSRGPGRARARQAGRRRGRGFAVLADERERRPDRHLCPGLDEQLLDHAAREDLDLDVGLVGVHVGDDVAALDRCRPAACASRAACPRSCRRPVPASRTRPSDDHLADGGDDPLDARQRGVLEVLRVRHRHLGAADALRRASRAGRSRAP